MSKTLLIFICAAAAAVTALAQGEAVVGSAIKVKGLVTVSVGTTVSTVVNDAPMLEHSRYVTSSSGWVTLHYNNECDVSLEPNQWAEVDSAQDCEALIGLVGNVGDENFMAVLTARDVSPLLLGITGAAGAALVKRSIHNPPPSAH